MTKLCIRENAPSFAELADREKRRVSKMFKDDKRYADNEERIRYGAADAGASGLAMKKRPREFVPAVGVERLTDVSPIDFYFYTAECLSQRQANAGWELMGLYRAGFPQPRMVSRIGETGRELISPEQEAEYAEARKKFIELTGKIPTTPARMLSRVVRGEYPDCHMGVLRLQEALDIVADRLKLPQE
ncbi:hypothetical protein WSS15_23540 [Acetobacter pasteurianus]|uniref:hypothetical protein n=1 Tax=Acetobacter TaxID=434 RepID=UPI000875A951|nr:MULTISPECIES: hypothetical protein [Acetobacter]AOW48388.1 hypothetical protein A4R89_02045 [Acetobacter ascendens]GLH29704.1 hypothetical protein WSS15_23540 [Acetobacter pasteurianus]